ncbi:uncharacterized protein LOC125248412 isoform X2 [Megalobrama amblycephala]|uniref:uncharacterized protein LOC125248412 isoform X2 n=1 Tax=Megalobrama amblycephala TaxID=75352 RepID=UPI0020142E48|nr:uncharacterized protein LOC125248412 isoform X2 [Megalobrama amblycephala]
MMVPVQCEDIDKISVQCQDDQFGLNAEVVYGKNSFPLRRCTPFVTGSYHGVRVTGQNHTAAGQVQDSFAVNGQINATVGFSTDTDAVGADSLTFTDGISPGFMEPDGMGDNGHELMNGDERYRKEKHVHPKGKKKKPKRGGRTYRIHNYFEKVSVQCQHDPYGCGGVVVNEDETFPMTSSCIPDITGYNQSLSRYRHRFSAGVITAENWNDG